jgi:hypothetical protein
MLQTFAPGKMHNPLADHIAKDTASSVHIAAEDTIMWVTGKLW